MRVINHWQRPHKVIHVSFTWQFSVWWCHQNSVQLLNSVFVVLENWRPCHLKWKPPEPFTYSKPPTGLDLDDPNYHKSRIQELFKSYTRNTCLCIATIGLFHRVNLSALAKVIPLVLLWIDGEKYSMNVWYTSWTGQQLQCFKRNQELYAQGYSLEIKLHRFSIKLRTLL